MHMGMHMYMVAQTVVWLITVRSSGYRANKKPGRSMPPGDSLFSTLFNVAASGGK